MIVLCFVLVILGTGSICMGGVHAWWRRLERREIRRAVERKVQEYNASKSKAAGSRDTL